MMPLRLTIFLLRSALYTATMAATLWYLYRGSYQIEPGVFLRGPSLREVAVMTLIMALVPLVAWLFTWKLEAEYGTLVAALTSGLLTGVGLVLFTFFVIGTIPALAWSARPFLMEEDLVFFFLVIPAATVTSAAAVALTSPLVRKRKNSLSETPPD